MQRLIPLIPLISSQDEPFCGAISRYSGTLSKTKTGISCQTWGVPVHPDEPHKRVPIDAVEKPHNYCRAPDGDMNSVWCYTTDPDKRWEYCELPSCNDDMHLVFSYYNPDTQVSEIYGMSADARRLQELQGKNSFDFTSEDPDRTGDEYWALAVNPVTQTAFVSDFKGEHVKMIKIGPNGLDFATTITLDGIGHGIESLAVDWISGYIYWTDSNTNWIGVMDPSHVELDFPLFGKVFGTDDTEDLHPYGLAVDPISGRLVYSEYSPNGAGSIRSCPIGSSSWTDCKNLVQFPTVHQVRSLSLSYDDETTVYWTDYRESSSLVMSIDIYGKQREPTVHVIEKGAWFWDVVHYNGWLFITDFKKYAKESTPYRMIMAEAQDPDEPKDLKVASLWLKNKPRSLALFPISGHSDYFQQPAGWKNSCENEFGDQKCTLYCLSNGQETEPSCRCNVGYEVSQSSEENTKPCEMKHMKEIKDTLLIADSIHDAVYQMEISENKPSRHIEYGFIKADEEMNMVSQFTAMSIDASMKLYWVDAAEQSIKVYDDLESEFPTTRTIIKNDHKVVAKDMEIDEISKNLFWVHNETMGIYACSTDESQENNNIRLIQHNNAEATFISDIALDMINLKLFFTDAGKLDNGKISTKGRLVMMNYDGSEAMNAVNGLRLPTAVHIDPIKRKLYLAESLVGKIHEIDLAVFDGVHDELHANELFSEAHAEHVRSWSGSMQDHQMIYITRMVTHGNYIYFVEETSNRVYRILRTASEHERPTPYSPSDFYRISDLLVIDPKIADALYDQIETGGHHEMMNACLGNGECAKDELCVLKQTQPYNSYHNCIPKDSIQDTQLPYSINCLGYQKPIWSFNPDECSEYANVTIRAPEFRDNSGSVKVVEWPADIGFSNKDEVKSVLLKVGLHGLKWVGRDGAGNSAVCEYMVKIENNACKPIASVSWSDDFLVSESCASRSGSIAEIRCRDEGNVLFNPDDDIGATDFIHLTCQNGQWEPIGAWSCRPGDLEAPPFELFHDDAPEDSDTANPITDSPSDVTESTIFGDSSSYDEENTDNEPVSSDKERELTEIEKSSPAAISLFVVGLLIISICLALTYNKWKHYWQNFRNAGESAVKDAHLTNGGNQYTTM